MLLYRQYKADIEREHQANFPELRVQGRKGKGRGEGKGKGKGKGKGEGRGGEGKVKGKV